MINISVVRLVMISFAHLSWQMSADFNQMLLDFGR